MPLYHFQSARDGWAETIDLPDDRSAWREAQAICRDLSRDIIDALDRNPEWHIDVTDAIEKPIFRFSFLAKTF
jgi:hypothetical protein